MAAGFTLSLAGVEKMEGAQLGEVRLASPGWHVHFSVEAPRASYNATIFVEAECPTEDIVRHAMHRFHRQMTELAEEMAGWRLP